LKKKILITGGSGFIASHVADELTNNNYDVTIYDLKKPSFLKKKQKFYTGDIRNLNKLKKITNRTEILYHFAATADLHEANVDPQKTISNNIIGTLNVLQSCVDNKIKKIIFASSIYALSEQGGFYSTSKLASEMLIERYAKAYGINYIILRFGTVYGPRANSFNTVNNYVKSAKKYKKILRNSPGKEMRRYIHVKDVTKICLKLINNKYNNKYFNIVGQKKIIVRDLLKIIKKCLPSTKIKYIKSDKRKYNYKNNPFTYKIRAGKTFKLKKYINLEEGINNLINKKNENI